MEDQRPPRAKAKFPQPGELWSVWDMINSAQVAILTDAGEALGELDKLYEKSFYEERPRADEERAAAAFIKLSLAATFLGDETIASSMNKLSENIPKDYELYWYVRDQFQLLTARKTVLALGGEAEKYLRKRHPFGERVYTAFPTSVGEIDDAGKCLAYGQHSAAVFHLMRALEPSLQAFADRFGVKFKDHWNSTLDEIEKAVRDRDNIKNRPEWASEKDYWIDAVTHFFHIKNAWRNYTMHLRIRYDKEKAEEVYEDVRRFMIKLAEKLSE